MRATKARSCCGRQQDEKNLIPTPLKLKTFSTHLRKSYIDKTTRTSEQVVRLYEAAQHDAKGGPGVINLTKGFLDLLAIGGDS